MVSKSLQSDFAKIKDEENAIFFKEGERLVKEASKIMLGNVISVTCSSKICFVFYCYAHTVIK